MNFYNGSTLLGSGTVNASGVATLTTSSLPAGTDSLTAVYSGNTNDATSTSPAITANVAPDATTTTLSASSLTPTFGTSVVLTATITPTPTGSPLGSVNFYNGSTLLGSGTVNASGVATLTTSSLPAGTDSLTRSTSETLTTQPPLLRE